MNILRSYSIKLEIGFLEIYFKLKIVYYVSPYNVTLKLTLYFLI